MAGSGAIHNRDSDPIIQNSTFDSNHVSSLYLSSGGAVSNENSSPTITHCSFYANTVKVSAPEGEANGGAIASSGSSNPIITNSILWANEAPSADTQFHDDDTSHTVISYSDVDQYVPDGTQNLRAAPRFNADLHLKPGSPCIGTADASATLEKDMDGEDRSQGGTPDMGADEFLDGDGDGMPDFWERQHEISTATEDGDGDGITNLSEYNLGTDPNAAQHVLDATLRGSVQSDGTHQVADLSTPAGEADHAYFGFNLTSRTSEVTEAALRIELADYNTNDVPARLYIWDVSTAAAVFSTDLNGTTGVDVYNDLGGGTRYGKTESSPTDAGSVLDIRLNPEAVIAINSAMAGSGDFIIGMGFDHWGTGNLLFSQADEVRIHQIVLMP